VYELDGLQSGPISVGKFDCIQGQQQNDMSWLTEARRAIQKRIERYQSSEIKFNLMALTQDRISFLQSQIKGMLEAGLSESDEAIEELKIKVLQEEELRKQWADENERRRHNYLPFCMELIRELARSGLLQNYTKRAREKKSMSLSK
jgi:ubiquitin carboxyl-terminal hydrolase L5